MQTYIHLILLYLVIFSLLTQFSQVGLTRNNARSLTVASCLVPITGESYILVFFNIVN